MSRTKIVVQIPDIIGYTVHNGALMGVAPDGTSIIRVANMVPAPWKAQLDQVPVVSPSRVNATPLTKEAMERAQQGKTGPKVGSQNKPKAPVQAKAPGQTKAPVKNGQAKAPVTAPAVAEQQLQAAPAEANNGATQATA